MKQKGANSVRKPDEMRNLPALVDDVGARGVGNTKLRRCSIYVVVADTDAQCR